MNEYLDIIYKNFDNPVDVSVLTFMILRNEWVSVLEISSKTKYSLKTIYRTIYRLEKKYINNLF